MLLCWIWVCLANDKLGFEPVLSLAEVPEESTAFLRQVTDLSIGEDGTIHVLDIRSAKVFTWRGDGSYQGSFGNKGQGPGEFSFQGAGGGKISATGNFIYVYDDGTKAVSVFDPKQDFVRAFPLEVSIGTVYGFDMASDEHAVVAYSHRIDDRPLRILALFNKDGKHIRDLYKQEDNTYKVDADGEEPKMVLIPYATRMISRLDDRRGTILVGDNADNKFNVMDLQGNSTKTLTLELRRRPLVAEDKAEWNEQPWFKNQSFFQAEFPERKPFYNRITPVGESGYLVYVQSVYHNHCEGIYIDEHGKTLGRFSLKLGENGGLFGSKGKLVAFTTDAEGEFTGQIWTPTTRN